MLVTPGHIKQFQEEGYFALERAFSESEVEKLKVECGRYVEKKDAAMARAGATTEGVTHRGNRYFAKNSCLDSPYLMKFLLGSTIEQVVRPTLGDDVYLFRDLFAVKYPNGMEFGWHQDSGYMRGRPHKPYLTCWCPLDDVTVENGTIWFLPFSMVDSRNTISHVRDKTTNDLIGYDGDEEGVPVEVPAGSLVVFSSMLLHRTGVNRTDRQRRAYFAEYTAEPILNIDGSPWNLVIPFIRDGCRVSGP